MVNIDAKFEVSSFNRSQDMEGSQNSKSRSCDLSRHPLTYFFIFIVIVGLVMVNMRAKFQVS